MGDLKTQRVQIKDGQLTAFADEICPELFDLVDYSTTRVSRIVPVSWPLRLAFRLLRFLFSDHSAVAAWTRRWPCRWRVLIGHEVFGPFDLRDQAIAFEKQWIWERLGD